MYFLVWTWVTTGYCTKNEMLEIPGPKILTANSSTTSSYMANLWYPTNWWWVFTRSRIWQAVFLHQNHQPFGRWLTQSLRLRLYFDHHLVLSSAKIDVCLVCEISLTNKKHRTYLLMSKINSMSQTCTSPFIQQFRLIQPHLCDNCGWESPSLLTKRPPKAPSWGHTSQVDGTPKCPPGAGGNWCAQLSWSNTQTGSKYSNPQER